MSDFCVNLLSALNDWQELDPQMRAMLLSLLQTADCTSLNARLAAIETQVSTLALGLEKLQQRHNITPKPGESVSCQDHYWSLKGRTSL